MASVNKVIMVGNVGGAPELRYTPAILGRGKADQDEVESMYRQA